MSSDSNNQDARLSKRADNGSARADRILSDRPHTENREATDRTRAEERRAMLRDTNTLLPPPPEMPGYHLVWLTTNNQRDSLENRFRLGYELVKRSELPDFVFDTQKSGEVTEDRITVNEMVLAKISMDDWRSDMLHLHHELPNESIRNLKDSVRIGRDGRGQSIAYSGGEFTGGVADGYDALTLNRAPSLNGIS